jgi:hypothetical protein
LKASKEFGRFIGRTQGKADKNQQGREYQAGIFIVFDVKYAHGRIPLRAVPLLAI